MNKKLVSIIINCHNGEKFLKQCIDSIINQTYKHWEIIFWDNKSTDSSKKIFKSYTDKRLHYFYSKKKDKLYTARNKAIKKANGSFLAFLDTDDYWIKENLSLRKKFFEDERFIFSYSNYFKFFEKTKNIKIAYSKKLPQDFIFEELLHNYCVSISSLIIRKDFFKKLKLKFEDRYDIIGDYDLVLRMSENNLVHSSNVPSVYIRYHKKNLSRDRSKFFNEYLFWYKRKISKPIYKRYISLLKNNLDHYEIIMRLYDKKDYKLFKKILSFPIFFTKLKMLIGFVIPIKVISKLSRSLYY